MHIVLTDMIQLAASYKYGHDKGLDDDERNALCLALTCGDQTCSRRYLAERDESAGGQERMGRHQSNDPVAEGVAEVLQVRSPPLTFGRRPSDAAVTEMVLRFL